MPRTSRKSLAFLPVQVGCAMGPVSCREVARWSGEETPDPVRERWLQQIEGAAHEQIRARGAVTPWAVAVGPAGVQLSTSFSGGARLNADASELVLFGNTGRTGDQRLFHLAGSSLDAYAVTTAAIGAALPLDVQIGGAPGQSFAVGATLGYTVGNTLYVARDLGSFFSGEPLEVWARFPVVHTDGPALRAGQGVGLDVGFQWEAEPWRVGLAVQNVVNTFAWDIERLVFRPATALITDDDADSDFAPRPAGEAPENLLAAVRDFRFGPRVRIGFSRALSERARLFGQIDARLAPSATPDPPSELGAAIEYAPRERIPLRLHASVLNGGLRLGGGAGLRIGWLTVSGAGSYRSDHDLAGPDWMLTLSNGGG